MRAVILQAAMTVKNQTQIINIKEQRKPEQQNRNKIANLKGKGKGVGGLQCGFQPKVPTTQRKQKKCRPQGDRPKRVRVCKCKKTENTRLQTWGRPKGVRVCFLVVLVFSSISALWDEI